VNDASSIRFETLPSTPDPTTNVTLVPAADADQVVQQLRTFGGNTPKAPTVAPDKVKVRVTDGTGTNVGPSVVSELVTNGFKATAAPTSARKADVTEIRYGYDQAEEAEALLPYFTDAKLVPDPKAAGHIELVLGSSFQDITVPSTTTTAAPSTVPGAPVTTAPPTTTRTLAPSVTDPCR
jgi:hypothetical protein